MEIYGGRIWAKNNPGGRGSSFRLLLPVELGQAESAEAADIQPRPDESGPADDGAASDADDKLTILVVEDNDATIALRWSRPATAPRPCAYSCRAASTL